MLGLKVEGSIQTKRLLYSLRGSRDSAPDRLFRDSRSGRKPCNAFKLYFSTFFGDPGGDALNWTELGPSRIFVYIQQLAAKPHLSWGSTGGALSRPWGIAGNGLGFGSEALEVGVSGSKPEG